MADKTVVVRLRAEVAAYIAGLKKAGLATRELVTELSGAGTTAKRDLDQVGRVAAVTGGALLFGFGKAAGAVMGFDKQLSELSAVSSATTSEMTALREAALEAGAATVFSASEAAQAQTELAKAGVSTADILGGGLTGALDLAAAGGLDLARAAEIAASSMTTFGLAGGDVSTIADTLAAGANKSAADVETLAQALAQSGLVADQFGLDLEDTVGVLSMFAQNGLKGSDAGTSFKTMLQRLVPQSDQAAEKMAELGIDMFNAQGEFVGIEAAAEELKDGLSGLTEEQRNSSLATVFGSDAVRAATVLYQGGAAGVAEWVGAVDDAGFASEVAAERMNNLAGDLEELRGAIETALIESGSHANGTLRFLTQSATGAVQAFAGLPGPVQGSVTALAGLGGVGLTAVGGLTLLIPKIHEARTSLAGIGPAGVTANRALGTLGRVAGGAAGIAAFASALVVLSDQVNRLIRADAPNLDRLGLSLVDFGQQSAIAGELASAFGDDLSGLQDDLDLMMDRRSGFHIDIGEDFDEAVDRIDAIDKALSQLVDSGHADLAASTMAKLQDTLDGDAWAQFEVELNDYTDALARNESQTKLTGDANEDELAPGMEEAGRAAAIASGEVQTFGEVLDDLYQQLFGVEGARDAFQRGLNELPGVLAAAAEEGLGLNDVLLGQSDQALDVREQLRGMVEDAGSLIEEWEKQGLKGEELQIAIAMLSQSFEDQMVAAGLPAPVVDHYLGLLGQIPVSANTDLYLTDHGAEAKLDRLIAKLGQMRAQHVVSSGYPILYGVPGLEKGGRVGAGMSAPGPADTIPLMAAPGEYVVSRRSAEDVGYGALDHLNRTGTLPAGAPVAQQFGIYQGTGGGSAPNIYDVTVDMRGAIVASQTEFDRMIDASFSRLNARDGSVRLRTRT